MINGWLAEGDGPKWLGALNSAEVFHHIPHNLLARIAYQESSFRPGVITGMIASPVGALGIMQLMPQFFLSVRADRPFTAASTIVQIDQAGGFLESLHARFGDWQEAVAAYNWGGGNLHHDFIEHGRYELTDMPLETQTYVKDVFTDVPIQGALLA